MVYNVLTQYFPSRRATTPSFLYVVCTHAFECYVLMLLQCDLHMPNKDGYQACREIRRWEKKHGYRRHPIIALSANVLGDVYAKCVEAGFNSYVTKPVEFKELSLVMTKFLDPPDKTKPPELMKIRKT